MLVNSFAASDESGNSRLKQCGENELLPTLLGSTGDHVHAGTTSMNGGFQRKFMALTLALFTCVREIRNNNGQMTRRDLEK